MRLSREGGRRKTGEVGVPSDPSLSEKPRLTCTTFPFYPSLSEKPRPTCTTFPFFFFLLAVITGFAAVLEIARRVFATTISCGRVGKI